MTFRRTLGIAVAVLAAFGLSAGTAFAQVTVREVRAVRAASPPVIDGRLDDAIWKTAEPVSGFLQRDPSEGQPATDDTDVRIAFDDVAIYVAARLHDRHPAAIVRQLSRRDASVDADAFILYLDPHHDQLTGAQFGVSAAGVQRDALIYNDNFLDSTWDAVWESAVSIDAGGWNVEMRIPLSQLRFPRAEHYTWGINAQRIVQRRSESDWLQLVPKNESGLASRMAHLEGIADIHPPPNLALMPYATSRGEFIKPPVAGNPFNDGSRFFASAGMDLKYGVTSSMTLDATFNPDFGQVEVDPAVVNLTAFETFFEERRPFFTEGAQVFSNFGKSGASSYTSYFFPEPTLFYSRRIGRTPQGKAVGGFTDVASSTTILGAGKLIGRTRSGWTVGALDAVTGREDARVSNGLVTTQQEVEPPTNYAVLRLQRELGRRGQLGFIGTSVIRNSSDAALDSYLVRNAELAGVDGHFFLDAARKWVVHGGIAGSWVNGSTSSVARVQRAEQRYYQRPDAPHVRFDPTRTSLSGWEGKAFLNRNSGNLTVNAGIWGMSPGFEVNDAGYATQTDRAGGHGMVQWRKLTPTGWTRERYAWVAKWWTWNYGNECQGDGWQASASALFRNFWRETAVFTYAKRVWDDKLTRGGPTVVRPGNRGIQLATATDSRKPLVFTLGLSYSAKDYNQSSAAVDLQGAWRPFPALTLSTGPTWQHNISAAQYLATIPDPLATRTFGSRYVFGDLDQTQLSFVTRASIATSPRTSLQVYMQPLVSVADYGQIKEVYAPRTFDFVRYGLDGGSTIESAGRRWVIDPDGSGAAPSFSIAKPDFDLRSLRLNVVFRWEFRPGSSFYAVWTQQRRDQLASGEYDFNRDFGRVFTAPADDVFLVKISYWFGLHR